MKGFISSAEIREATGLSQKTLTRWHKAGHIPEPEIGQHPGGRGKMGFYPRRTLALIRRIIELRKQGHALAVAAAKASESPMDEAETETIRSIVEERIQPRAEGDERRGRRTILTPTLVQVICDGVRVGLSNERAAIHAGASQSSFYKWLERGRDEDEIDPIFAEFVEELKGALADFQEVHLSNIRRAALEVKTKHRTHTRTDPKGGVVSTEEWEDEELPNWNASAWLLARKFPEEFGRSQRLEHSGKLKQEHSGSIHTGPRKVTLELVRPDRKAETIVRDGKDPVAPESVPTKSNTNEEE